MGVARLGSHRFRLDPASVVWDYSIRTTIIHSIGGRIIQVLGSKIGNITMSGSFGVGDWKEQHRFLEAMKAIGSEQVEAQQIRKGSKIQPPRFKYPPRGWDFGVFLLDYKQPGSSRSVHLAPDVVAPTWQLTLMIVDGAEGLQKVSRDAHIARLSKGIGWKQTEYNGPMSLEDAGIADGEWTYTDGDSGGGSSGGGTDPRQVQ